MAITEKSDDSSSGKPETVVAYNNAADNSQSEEDIQAARARILEQQELQKTEPPVLPITTLFRGKKFHPQLEEIATQPSVYDDPALAKYFQPTEKYENLHRFDPSARWTWAEELPLINKLDWKITAWACVAFFALDLDRGNLSQANTDNFLDDLGLSTNDFNLGNTVFRLSFLCAELPSQLISKKLGPDRWPLGCCASVVFTAKKAGDGSSFLKSEFGHGSPWSPPPTQTKSWWNKKGWFDEREEIIMVNRILRDDPSKGDMHNRQAVDFKLLWKSLCDYDLWPMYIIGLTFLIPTGPPDAYLTLTLRNIGFSTFDSNLLTIPTQVLGAITMLVLTYFSEIWNERSLMGVFAQIWVLPTLIALLTLPDTVGSWAKFAVLTVLLSYPSNRRGNKQLTAICAANIVIYLLGKAYYIWRNKQRDQAWSALSKDEQIHYLETTTDAGSKRKDFRFAH
ncbi:hypothetical protein Neosp_004647 [[Neocosmospora] mangrovei]